MWGHAGFFFSFIMCVPVHVCTCACHSMYLADPVLFFFFLVSVKPRIGEKSQNLAFFDIPGQESYGGLWWLSNRKQVYFNDLFVLIQNCKRNGGLPLSRCFLDVRTQTDPSDWEACQEDTQGRHVRDSSEAGPGQNRVKHTEAILKNTERPSACIYGEWEPMPWSLQGQRRVSGGRCHLTTHSIFCHPWSSVWWTHKSGWLPSCPSSFPRGSVWLFFNGIYWLLAVGERSWLLTSFTDKWRKGLNFLFFLSQGFSVQ